MTPAFEAAFKREKILSMSQVKDILGTGSRMTAFRQLRKFHYFTSYSHKGMFYTLPGITEFDEFGLWSHRNVYFSRHGTLLETISELVQTSPSGYTASELEIRLHVFVQNSVKHLLDRGVLNRKRHGNSYVYFYSGKTREQLTSRKRELPGHGKLPPQWGRVPEDIVDYLATFLGILDEKQTRLYLGLESLKLGHGGDILIADLAGVNFKTVARGRSELQSRGITAERVRESGAGRPPIKKKRRSSSSE